MPQDQKYNFFKKNELLRYEEIATLVSAFVQLGLKHIKLTGGEPLLYPKLAKLLNYCNAINWMIFL